MDWGLDILTGDCRDILPTLRAESVQCCVTSPPYWGLRDYGTAQWEGGEAGCDHRNGQLVSNKSTLRLDGRAQLGPYEGEKAVTAGMPYGDTCGKCGARRIDSQLGLEATPQEYISKMVAVFREVWRVLRDDGTLWCNMGDSYNSATSCDRQSTKTGEHGYWQNGNIDKRVDYPGLKPKDLCGMPWRLAFALQADGWYLRSDIIWHKPNPMPESVTDRPTKAHEYIFLLTKAERYFYDAEAIREKSINPDDDRKARSNSLNKEFSNALFARMNPGSQTYEWRNRRTVWTIPTQPYAEAHFATFPEEIPKLCILAGSKPGDTVLDPFAGSGTTGQVAIELGRKAVLIELNPAYIELAHERTNVTLGWF